MHPIALGFLFAFGQAAILTAYCLAIRRPAESGKLKPFFER